MGILIFMGLLTTGYCSHLKYRNPDSGNHRRKLT
jgi:hypothetical protein